MSTKTILVVDQDRDVAALLTFVLQEEGYGVTTATSLQEATALLSESKYDLIITEAFGQSNIFEFDPAFLKELKSFGRATPIILCSTFPSTDYLPGGEYGLADVIPKPFEIEKLLDKVNKALSDS